MQSMEEKAEQRQQPVMPKKPKKTKLNNSTQASANGGSSSSAADESSSLSRTASPPSNDADGKGQQQHHQQDGGGGKSSRLVWTNELHHLFVEAYDSLGDEVVPRKILMKMNEKMNIPELTREKVASHLQKYKLHLKSLGEEASSHSPTTEEAQAPSHPQHPLPPNTTPLPEVSQQAQLELVHQVLQAPLDYLSRSSSIAANLQIVGSIQQQLLEPPIMEDGQAQPAETETMQRAPADYSNCCPVGMETSTAAICLVSEANTEIRMAQDAKAENVAAEPEEAAPPAGSILGQFWASLDNQASTSSWDIFVL